MFDKMKQLMEMKKQADKIKKELDATEVECNDIRGIEMVMTGSQIVRSVKIDDQLMGTDNKSRLEQDLVRAFNAAVAQSQKVAARKMQSSMGGSFPGL